MPIFNRKLLGMAIANMPEIPNLAEKRAALRNWKQAIESGAIKQAGEIALHGDFLIDLFCRVLGYARLSDSPALWHLSHEQKSVNDATKADGALGFFTPDAADVRAVIELKRSGTDLDAKQGKMNRSPVEQAFSYAPKHGKLCRWVIVSNYEELRLYHASSALECEEFRVAELTQDAEFSRFYALLCRERFLSKQGDSATDALYFNSAREEREISARFYEKYAQMRRMLFAHLKYKNPFPLLETASSEQTAAHELLLLEKAQKLLDRCIFVFFCEDSGELLPEKTFRTLARRAQETLALAQFGEQKIWIELKALFRALDDGLKTHNIPGFNGELFKPDAALDALRIEDAILLQLAELAEYDFRSDLNVNILGHIFEQSLPDLEELRAEIRGEPRDAKPGKRKKEGIFYTPEYITRYIVEQAVGGWLADRWRELGGDALPELMAEDEAWLASSNRNAPSARIARRIACYEAYWERVRRVTILDPACGSGAFLTQAFDFLLREGARVNKELARLRLKPEQSSAAAQPDLLGTGERVKADDDFSGAFDSQRWAKAILRHNLFGVDLNRESVEITKLALWLKTAKKDDRLIALNQHIKCGNALIDEPAVAGGKAFDWRAEFPEIMRNGGFDVVIGNPPYGATLTEQEQKHVHNAYDIGSTDTAILFIKRCYHLLHSQGALGFIIPKAFCFSSNYHQIRDDVWDDIASIVDCGTVWKEVKLEQVIITLIKGKSAQRYASLSRQERAMVFLAEIDKSLAKEFGFFLNNVSHDEIAIAHKMRSDSLRLDEIATNRRGVGLQQFIRSDGDIEVIGGAEIDKFGIRGIKGKIRQEKATIPPFAFVKENSVLAQNIVAFIENPSNHIKIIACIPNKENILLLDTINQLTIQPDYSNYYIWCLLNSTLVNWYVYRFIFAKAIRTMHFDSTVTSRIPIPKISYDAQRAFIETANAMLELNKQLCDTTRKFLRFLDAAHHPKSLSNRLELFYDLDFSAFVAELQKQGVKLTKTEQKEFLEFFETEKARAADLRQQIAQADAELDNMIYALYGLTDDEIAIIEGA